MIDQPAEQPLPDICDAVIETPKGATIGPDDVKDVFWSGVLKGARIRALEETCAMFELQVAALKERNGTLAAQIADLTSMIESDERRVTTVAATGAD